MANVLIKLMTRFIAGNYIKTEQKTVTNDELEFFRKAVKSCYKLQW